MTKTKKMWSLAALALIVIIVGVSYFMFMHTDEPQIGDNVVLRGGSEDAGITFTYEAGATAFSLTESVTNQATSSELLKAYVIMDAQAQQAHLADFENSSTPPAISVLAFQLPDNASRDPETGERIATTELLERWLAARGSLSNVDNKTTELAAARVDGETALYFESTGTFEQATHAVKSRDKVFLLTVQYESKVDPLYQQYEALVESVRIE